MKFLTRALIFSSIPSLSFAFFCPTNFNQIDYGNTIDQVIQQCGKPDQRTEQKQPNENVPQQWTFYAPQGGSDISGLVKQSPPSSKVEVTLDSEGNVVNILVNGVSVGSTLVCGSSVRVGSTRDQLKSACGTPTFVTRQTAPDGSKAFDETVVTNLIYNKAIPAATLVFENGILKDKK